VLLGSGTHALAQVLHGGLPSALRAVGLHAATGPSVLAPAPGDEPAHPWTSAPVAQPDLGSGGRLLSAAILFAVSGGVRLDLTGTRGGSPRQVAPQDETDPTRCLSSAAERPATVKRWFANEDLPQSFGLDHRRQRVSGHASDRFVPMRSGIISWTLYRWRWMTETSGWQKPVSFSAQQSMLGAESGA